MDKNTDSVMIALLPITSDWCHIDLPHLTLVYAGKAEDLQPGDFNKLAKDACSLSMMTRPITLRVLSREQFGNWSTDPEDAVDVYRLQPTSELLAMRHFVDSWNASEHPFNPHVTIGRPNAVVEVPPTYVAFDRICVGWGSEYLTFWLKR